MARLAGTCRVWILVTPLVFTGVIACQDKPSAESSDRSAATDQNFASFPTQESLPTCDEASQGKLVFVTDEKQFYVCDSGQYLPTIAPNASEVDEPQTEDPEGLTLTCDQAVDKMPKPTGVTGQLVVQIPSDVDPCSAAGFIVGNEDELKLQVAKNGDFFINNVPPGEHDVVITAGTLAIAGLTFAETANDRGIRMNNVKATTGLKTELGEITLPPLGKVSGTATLNADGVTDSAGINVYIPGTSYSAMTDDDGSYVITNVPPGAHSIYLEKDGFSRGQIEGFIVESGGSTAAPDMDLYLDAGISGNFSIVNSFAVNGKTIIPSTTARLLMAPSQGAVLMLVGDGGVTTSQWQPMSTNYSMTFDPSLYISNSGAGFSQIDSPQQIDVTVKFANANGLESDVIEKNPYIDHFAEGMELFVPEFDVALSGMPEQVTVSNVVIPEVAEDMAITYTSPSEYAEPVFGPLVTSAAFPVADAIANCGVHSVDVQFRTQGGTVYSPTYDRISASSTDYAQTVTKSCHVEVPSTADISTVGSGTFESMNFFYGAWTGSKAVIFGWDGAGDFNGAIYDPATQTWLGPVSGTNAPVQQKFAQVFSDDNYLYFLSGQKFDGSYANDFSVYDLVAGTWTNASDGTPFTNHPDLENIDRAYRRFALSSGKLHMIYQFLSNHDGDDGTTPEIDVMGHTVFDPTTNTWSSVENLTGVTARTYFILLPYQNSLLIIGGRNSSDYNDSDIVDSVDISGPTPVVDTSLADLPDALMYSMSGASLMWGNLDGGGVYFSDMQSSSKTFYDFDGTNWTKRTYNTDNFSANPGPAIQRVGNILYTLSLGGNSLEATTLTTSGTAPESESRNFSSEDRFYSQHYPTTILAIPGRGLLTFGGKYDDYNTGTQVYISDGAIIKTDFADQFAP